MLSILQRLRAIVARLLVEAQEAQKRAIAEAAENERREWYAKFEITNRGEKTNILSPGILRKAAESGFDLVVRPNGTIEASKPGFGTSYLYSNADILRFGEAHKIRGA